MDSHTQIPVGDPPVVGGQAIKGKVSKIKKQENLIYQLRWAISDLASYFHISMALYLTLTELFAYCMQYYYMLSVTMHF